jgi:two-component system cell cycle response regulator
MPGMDGYEVAAAINRRPELAGTRVVAVTASVMPGALHQITSAGFDGCITKPIDPETFISELNRFLPAAAAADPAAGAQ